MQLSDCVLCIDQDGHFKFDYAMHDCCADPTSHEVDHEDDDHCRDCLDLPIFASINTDTMLVTDAKHSITCDIVSLAALFPIETIVFPIQQDDSLTSIPPLINQPLISLRTVILLI